jgi:hypothetical protein
MHLLTTGSDTTKPLHDNAGPFSFLAVGKADLPLLPRANNKHSKTILPSALFVANLAILVPPAHAQCDYAPSNLTFQSRYSRRQTQCVYYNTSYNCGHILESQQLRSGTGARADNRKDQISEGIADGQVDNCFCKRRMLCLS